MGKLAHTQGKQGSRGRRPASATPRVLVVNKPIKSVRHSDEPSPTPVRLTIGIISVVGAIGVLWILGTVGFRLGFAPALRVPELTLSFDQAIIAGLTMLLHLPAAILSSGETHLELFLLLFGLICVPAGALSAARPRTPGGPPLSALASASSTTAAILCAIHTVAAIGWTVSPWRDSELRGLPLDPGAIDAWAADATALAGLDTLVLISASLWMVLAFRLPTPLWLKSLTTTAAIIGLAFVMTAFAISAGQASQSNVERSKCYIDAEQPHVWRLHLGNTPAQTALLRVTHSSPEAVGSGESHAAAVIELRDRPEVLTIIDQTSISGFVNSVIIDTEAE